MYIRKLCFGVTDEWLIHLKRYLNEILKLNPPLPLNGTFDNEFGKVVSQFQTLFNAKYPAKPLPYEMILSEEFWAAIGVMLGERRLMEEIESLKISDRALAELLIGGSLVQSFQTLTIEELRSSIYDNPELIKKINDCLKKLLGKNFSKVGEQTRANAPKIDARLTSAQIAKKFGMPDPPYATVSGEIGKHGTIFIGSEFFNDPNEWKENRSELPGRSPLQNAYIHELGNLIAYFASGNKNYYLFGVKKSSDDDSGYQLQLCVFRN